MDSEFLEMSGPRFRGLSFSRLKHLTSQMGKHKKWISQNRKSKVSCGPRMPLHNYFRSLDQLNHPIFPLFPNISESSTISYSP